MATYLTRVLGRPLSKSPCHTLLLSNLPCVTSKRGYKKEFLKHMRDRNRLAKRSFPRIIDDALGLPSTVPLPYDKEEKVVFASHPKYSVRVAHNETNPHYQKTPVYIFNQHCILEEGVRQALWLTKSKLMDEGHLPAKILRLGEGAVSDDMADRVHQSVKKSRQYDTTEKVIEMSRYSRTQTQSLMVISNLMVDEYPKILRRTQTDRHYVAASWKRGNDPIQVRGHAGTMMSSYHPIAPICGEEEISATQAYELPSFHPIAPTIDMLQYNVYKLNHNFTGFFDCHPHTHAHTLFVFDDAWWTRRGTSKGLHCKGIMFAFANALARARLQYGVDQSVDLETPIVTQSVTTDGVNFSFVVVQLNTLRTTSDDGIKNMVWLDADNILYDDQYPQDIKIIKNKRRKKTPKWYVKKMVTRRDPEVGCQELNIEVFRKFLSLYLHGA